MHLHNNADLLQVLGTPTREDIHAMNPNYTEFKFPHIKAHPWTKVFSKRLPADAVDLVSIRSSCMTTHLQSASGHLHRRSRLVGCGTLCGRLEFQEP